MCPAAALPLDEAARLAALRGLNLLDTPGEAAFDSLARLAARLCGTPIALVSLVDEKRQWFKARVGVDVQETSRDLAFCAHAILQNGMLEVCDARLDARFADNPLVIGGPQVRFYAGVPIRTSAGHAIGTVCVVDLVPRRLDDEQREMLRAIADQVTAQIELRRSLAEAAGAVRMLDDERILLRGVLQAATDYGVIGTTPSGTLNVFNRGAERLLGYRADEVIGRATPLLFHDPAEVASRAAEIGAAGGLEVFVGAARRGESEQREWTWIRKDGTRFPVAMTVTGMHSEANKLTGFIGIARDLTEERRAARERQRLADERAARAAADRSVARLTRLHDIAVALIPAKISREVLDILAGPTSASVNAETERFGEEERTFRLALGQLGAQALDRARAYESEATALRAARAANHAKDEFLAVLSHELRTPLTAVLGWTHMLRSTSVELPATSPTRLQHGLTVIENNATALLRTVEAVLDINRIVAGNVELNCGLIDLGTFIREAVEAMKPVAEAAGLTLTLSTEPRGPPISADPERLRQIVNNLLTNAIKFTPRGGAIHVSADAVDDRARLTVADTGEGVSPEFLPHMFERFVQADSTRTRAHGGLGIGLAIVKHLVELHAGTVTARSGGPGHGTELTVRLPLAVTSGEGR